MAVVYAVHVIPEWFRLRVVVRRSHKPVAHGRVSPTLVHDSAFIYFMISLNNDKLVYVRDCVRRLRCTICRVSARHHTLENYRGSGRAQSTRKRTHTHTQTHTRTRRRKIRRECRVLC